MNYISKIITDEETGTAYWKNNITNRIIGAPICKNNDIDIENCYIIDAWESKETEERIMKLLNN